MQAASLKVETSSGSKGLPVDCEKDGQIWDVLPHIQRLQQSELCDLVGCCLKWLYQAATKAAMPMHADSKYALLHGSSRNSSEYRYEMQMLGNHVSSIRCSRVAM